MSNKKFEDQNKRKQKTRKKIIAKKGYQKHEKFIKQRQISKKK